MGYDLSMRVWRGDRSGGELGSYTVPVEEGEVILGTWQSVVIVDPNRENNRRRVRLSFVDG